MFTRIHTTRAAHSAEPRHATGTRAGIAFLLIAFAAAWIAWSSPLRAAGPAPSQPVAQYEIRFMTEMIDHHAMAVQMAMLCQQKAVHEELIALCESVETSQQQEIATMQMWLAAWYGTMHQPEMSRGAEQTMARIAGMAPEEFEISFMTMMIRHHWKAIVRSAQCVDRAYHEDLIAMCEDIIVAQAAEIELMRTWLCSWYDVCNYGPKGRPGDAVMIG